jgi:S1-C subfamily serine protease
VRDGRIAGFAPIPGVTLGLYPVDGYPPFRVRSVQPHSPADEVGARPSDVVTELDGHPITRFLDALTVLNDKRPGDTIIIMVDREGTRHQLVPATLRAAP